MSTVRAAAHPQKWAVGRATGDQVVSGPRGLISLERPRNGRSLGRGRVGMAALPLRPFFRASRRRGRGFGGRRPLQCLSDFLFIEPVWMGLLRDIPSHGNLGFGVRFLLDDARTGRPASKRSRRLEMSFDEQINRLSTPRVVHDDQSNAYRLEVTNRQHLGSSSKPPSLNDGGSRFV